ncbi:hypothetical protein RN02_29490 [Pseudomonas sp. PI1]|nr:hypothetical protein RN02_29490 [Pseudomonas sp. PI1]
MPFGTAGNQVLLRGDRPDIALAFAQGFKAGHHFGCACQESAGPVEQLVFFGAGVGAETEEGAGMIGEGDTDIETFILEGTTSDVRAVDAEARSRGDFVGLAGAQVLGKVFCESKSRWLFTEDKTTAVLEGAPLIFSNKIDIHPLVFLAVG